MTFGALKAALARITRISDEEEVTLQVEAGLHAESAYEMRATPGGVALRFRLTRECPECGVVFVARRNQTYCRPRCQNRVSTATFRGKR